MKFTFAIIIGFLFFAVYCLCRNTSPAGALNVAAGTYQSALAEQLAELQTK